MVAPFVLRPVLAFKPWGGVKLSGFGKEIPAGATVGESWEVADLPPEEVSTVVDGRTLVDGGEFDGWDLRRLIAVLGQDLLGSADPTPGGRFPLLVKILDAAENLSVQVHPPASFVERNPAARLKTESWYVAMADPGAFVYLGTRPGSSREEVVASFGSAAVIDHLNPIRAERGMFFHLPAGLAHALGAGVTVVEVQTPSDTTFRVYDWLDEHERAPRDLHLAEASEALLLEPDGMLILPSLTDPGSRLLTSNSHYVIVEHRSTGAAWPDAELRIVMVVEGSIRMDAKHHRAGSTVLVPAAAARSTLVEASTGAVWLEIGLVQAVAETAFPSASSAISTSS